MAYLVSGIAFAFLFYLPLAIQVGFATAAVIAPLAGLMFGALIFVFINNPIVKRQTAFPKEKLLPGEVVNKTYGANFVFRLTDYDLDAFVAGGLMWAVGMKGKEATGGKLHLTNYRLYFQSHRLNRVRGGISIFLPQIDNVDSRIKYLVLRQAEVLVRSNTMRFVIGDPTGFVADVREAVEASESNNTKIAELASKFPEKCVAGLDHAQLINSLNRLINRANKVAEIKSLVVNPIGAIGSLLLSDLKDRFGKEPWNEHIDRTFSSTEDEI